MNPSHRRFGFVRIHDQVGRFNQYVFLGLLAWTLSGCGGGGLERAEISGNVTADGQPVKRGQVRFVPTGQTKGPSWSAWIKDGHYTTAGSKGTPVGELRVEIRAYRAVPGFEHVADDGDAPYEQYLPPKYNLESKLRMTIEPGSVSVEKDFALTSR